MVWRKGWDSNPKNRHGVSKMLSRSLYGLGLAAIAAISWGTIGLAQSYAQPTIDASWVVVFRLLFASCFFTTCFVLKKEYRLLDVGTLRSLFPWIILAASLISVNNICFIYGVRSTGIAMGSAATIGSAPIWAGLLTQWLLKKPLNGRWWLGAVLAASGVTGMMISQANSWHIDVTGLAVCLLAGLCYAGFTLSSGRLVKDLSPLTSTTCIFFIAFLITVVAALILGHVPTGINHVDWMVFIYLGVVPTGLAFMLYTTALRFIAAGTAVAMTLLDPVTSFCLALTVAKEPLEAGALIGLILILLGLRLIAKNDKS